MNKQLRVEIIYLIVEMDRLGISVLQKGDQFINFLQHVFFDLFFVWSPIDIDIAAFQIHNF